MDDGADKVALSWTTHPAKKQPARTAGVIVFLILLWSLVYWMTANLLLTALSVALMIGALGQYFFPTRYTFSGDKVRVKYSMSAVEKEWKNFRSFYPDRNGVLLSPFLRPRRLENFRGLYIRFDNNRDQVLEFLSRKIGTPER